MWPGIIKVNLIESAPELKVPIFLLQGRHDYVTPSVLAEEYYKRVDAPQKHFIWFEDSEWAVHIPDDIKPSFLWPSKGERDEWIEYSKNRPIAIPDPSRQLSTKWDFYSVIDGIEMAEYDLIRCEKIDDSYEMHIDPSPPVGPYIENPFQVLDLTEIFIK